MADHKTEGPSTMLVLLGIELDTIQKIEHCNSLRRNSAGCKRRSGAGQGGVPARIKPYCPG